MSERVKNKLEQLIRDLEVRLVVVKALYMVYPAAEP